MESSPLLVRVYAHDLAAADAPLPCDHDRLHVVGGAEPVSDTHLPLPTILLV